MHYFTGLQIITEPSIEPVTVAEVKEQLRLDGNELDVMISNLITAARMAVEGIIKRRLITTWLRAGFDRFCPVMQLPYSPVQSVDSIKYTDEMGVVKTLAETGYLVDLASDPVRITPAYSVPWPSIRPTVGAVSIEYTAGYVDDAADVPRPIRQAIISLVIDMYEHPEKSMEINLHENRTVGYMLNAYRNCTLVM